MADSSTTYDTLIAAIDVQIAALISSPQVSYRIGDISVSATDKLRELRLLRENLVKSAREIPYESLVTIQNQIDQFGEDSTDYFAEDI